MGRIGGAEEPRNGYRHTDRPHRPNVDGGDFFPQSCRPLFGSSVGLADPLTGHAVCDAELHKVPAEVVVEPDDFGVASANHLAAGSWSTWSGDQGTATVRACGHVILARSRVVHFSLP